MALEHKPGRFPQPANELQPGRPHTSSRRPAQLTPQPAQPSSSPLSHRDGPRIRRGLTTPSGPARSRSPLSPGHRQLGPRRHHLPCASSPFHAESGQRRGNLHRQPSLRIGWQRTCGCDATSATRTATTPCWSQPCHDASAVARVLATTSDTIVQSLSGWPDHGPHHAPRA